MKHATALLVSVFMAATAAHRKINFYGNHSRIFAYNLGETGRRPQ